MIRVDGLLKYPRTPHLEGSRLQGGDSASDQVRLREIAGRSCVIEEKLDGANAGLSFSNVGDLLLQSRGHFLAGGGRERHFNLFKRWANAHEDALFDVLRDRYIIFGEWMFAKHSMFYDFLPHLFIEFDVFDKQEQLFLSTPRRKALLESLPIVSAPILYSGAFPSQQGDLRGLIQPSLAQGKSWTDSLVETSSRAGLDVEKVKRQTDMTGLSEGIYVKIEDDDQVLARFKFVRSTFTQTLLDQDEHWQSRPIVQNGLRPGVDLFSPVLNKDWISTPIHEKTSSIPRGTP